MESSIQVSMDTKAENECFLSENKINVSHRTKSVLTEKDTKEQSRGQYTAEET